jgi:cobaltochelatase CobS
MLQIEPMAYPIRSTFNIAEAPEKAQIMGLKPGLPGVPDPDPFYQFETDRLRDLTMFWVGGFKALLVEGDPSAGKSSFIEQWHARLNVPLDKVACSPDIQNYQLIGQFVPQADGTLKWNDGPIIKACRQGTSVLLDEYNTLEPAQATALNLLLEGYAVTIPETGETIKPAPTTRFFATQNSVDSLAAVSGRNVMDVANEDRFFYMEVDYLKPEIEEALVYRVLVAGKVEDSQAKNLAKLTVRVANDVRQAFREGAEAIEKPISTRAVLKWAKLASMYTPVMAAKQRSGLHYAMRRALKMSVTMTQAVSQYITLAAGFDENLKS